MTDRTLRRKLLNYIDANAERLGEDACELLHDIADALADQQED